jgi:hypothetical protein
VPGLPMRRVAASMGMLVSAAVLGGCEYADAGPLAGASPAALPSGSGAVPASPGAQEEAHPRRLIADVEAQLGPETDRQVISVLGGMGSTGSHLMGIVPDHGMYVIRAACSPGAEAKLTVSQGSVQVLTVEFPCSGPHESTLKLWAGPVSATLAPTGPGESSVAAMRLEKAPATPTAGPLTTAGENSSP